jgi:hypothetical protein
MDFKTDKENKIDNQWLDIKAKLKDPERSVEELEHLTSWLLISLAELTRKGYTSVDGVSVDLYKTRVWNAIEDLGILPEYEGDGYGDPIGEFNDDWDDIDDFDLDFEKEDQFLRHKGVKFKIKL